MEEAETYKVRSVPLELSILGTAALGSLIAALERQPPENLVRFDFCGIGPTGVNSYRGFYDHLAIGWEDHAPTTVAGLLKTLREAVGQVYEGYKGGHYRMTRSTPVWVANYGQCDSTAIVAVDDIGYTTIIRTARVEV